MQSYSFTHLQLKTLDKQKDNVIIEKCDNDAHVIMMRESVLSL